LPKNPRAYQWDILGENEIDKEAIEGTPRERFGTKCGRVYPYGNCGRDLHNEMKM
jgi:hypothetical protein